MVVMVEMVVEEMEDTITTIMAGGGAGGVIRDYFLVMIYGILSLRGNGMCSPYILHRSTCEKNE